MTTFHVIIYQSQYILCVRNLKKNFFFLETEIFGEKITIFRIDHFKTMKPEVVNWFLPGCGETKEILI